MKPPVNFRFAIDKNAPYFSGHFEHHAIVPGARLLDSMMRKLRDLDALPSTGVNLAQVKFTAAVTPGATVECQFQAGAQPGQLKFFMTVDGQSAVHGLIKLNQP